MEPKGEAERKTELQGSGTERESGEAGTKKAENLGRRRKEEAGERSRDVKREGGDERGNRLGQVETQGRARRKLGE